MTLTLEIIGPQAAQLGAAARKVFAAAGGSIGRLADNDWVIPDPYISSHHARVHYRDGRYLLEDTSTNGVFVKSPGNRLSKGQLYPLQSGDRIFIDAFEIRVTVAAARPMAAEPSSVAVPPANMGGGSSGLLIPEDPFAEPAPAAPFSRQPGESAAPLPGLGGSDDYLGGASADPLELLGLGAALKPTAPPPRAADLAARSPLSDHYEPPATTPLPEPSDAVADALIPEDYDPLVDVRSAAPVRPPVPRQPPAAKPAPPPRPIPPPTAAPIPPPAPRPAPSRPPVFPPSPPAASVAPPRPAATPVPPPVAPPPTKPAEVRQDEFAALLAAAGLQDAELTPELAKNFGRILRVVVAGLMDVLRARGQIKEEFRMRATSFKVTDNNPLKFSANVEDALHNLLVKRNSAYLGPVESFEDAFDDVRHHQMAMLAGVRLAFESMLAAFEPEHLQEQFDKQLKRGSLLAVPAKMKYWELYRERFQDMAKDPESCFGDLFGDEFARAYEEQLARLRTAERSQKK